jgi:hypothetical protein
MSYASRKVIFAGVRLKFGLEGGATRVEILIIGSLNRGNVRSIDFTFEL